MVHTGLELPCLDLAKDDLNFRYSCLCLLSIGNTDVATSPALFGSSIKPRAPRILNRCSTNSVLFPALAAYF